MNTDGIKYHVIGDVHGMCTELVCLVQRMGPRRQDTVVFVGDLIDKGPHSDAVVSYVRRLSAHSRVVVVSGNHEEKYFRMRSNGRETETTLSPDNELWLKQATAETPYFKFWNYIVVHGGIFPAFYDSYSGIPDLHTQQEWPKKLKERIRRFDKVRYVNPRGNMVALGQETSDDVFWADVYDGRDGFAIYGHQPYSAVRNHNHAIGIDTGAVLGNSLTGLSILEGVSPEIFSVQASRAYAEFF